MSKPEFVHLHLHTEFSLLDGAIKHGPLMDRIVEDGARAVGVTDHGNLFGAVGFYDAAVKRELKPKPFARPKSIPDWYSPERS